MRRVLVTGLGMVSPLGDTVGRFWEGMRSGEGAVRERPMPERYMELRHYYPAQLEERDGDPETSRTVAFARRAAAEAIADAGLGGDALRDAAVSIGTAMGRYDVLDRRAEAGTAPAREESEFLDVSGVLAAAIGASGPCMNVSTACSAGAYAVAAAMDLVARGDADVVVAGGAESFCLIPQGCFNRLGALDPLRCRPFSLERHGTVFGEGAAVLVLEAEEVVRRRAGAKPYAEVRGYGVSCDGHHLTAPESSGAQIRRAAREAFEHARIAPAQIDAVVAHGTGTQLNDEIEGRILDEVLGGRPEAPWVVPVKAQIGHGGGSAGASSCLLGALLVDRQEIPPAGITGEIDAACRVRLRSGAPAPARIRTVLVNAYAFGGNNISLVLAQPRAE